MSEFLLWADFETTGLDVNDLTALEVSWTVTNADLVQLTPLRSRFCAIATGRTGLIEPTTAGPHFVWSNGAEVRQVVTSMHRMSGLMKEWLAAPEFARLRTPSDLERLVHDDLAAAGVVTTDKVYLAGAGVSHFDALLLKAMGVLSLLHYRQADVSSAITLLGIDAPKNPEELEKLVADVVPGGSDPAHFWRLQTDHTTSGLVGKELIVPGHLVEHRAAPDVAFSLVLARVLRAMVRS